MFHNRFILLFGFIVAFVVNAGATEVLSLLERDTWAFSQEECAQLNAVEVARFNDVILSIIATTTGNLPVGVLVDFQIVDLNADGISEIIASVDVSGRGLLRDVAVLSKKDGAYLFDTIPTYGGAIDLWKLDEQQLLVGQQPAYELSRADPLITYPLLYLWTGVKGVDVSGRGRLYYETTFLPLINASLKVTMEQNIDKSRDHKRQTVLRLVGLSRSVIKVNSLFEQPLVTEDQLATVKEMLGRFVFGIKEDPDGVITSLLQDAKVKITNEISRITSLND
jgi:hypothetical protein